MKRILIIGAVLLLSSCASSEGFAYHNCVVDGCEITAVHNHASIY